MSLYDVQTDRFGTITVERDSIAEARTWAREALGVRNKRCVTRTQVYVQCEGCGSAPCTCPGRPR